MPLITTKGMGPSSVGTTLTIVSATANTPPDIFSGSVTIAFSDTIVVAGSILNPLNWSISPFLLIENVSQVGGNITLTTAEQLNGVTYTITVPNSGIVDASSGSALLPPYTIGFTGIGVPPGILYSRLINETIVEIEYTKQVIVGQAVTTSNYALSGRNYCYSSYTSA